MDHKDKFDFDLDRFPCSVAIVKEEREEDYDYNEGGSLPCSVEMVKQELHDETVVERQSCSAEIKQEAGGKSKTKRFPCDKCSEVFDSAFVRWRHMGDAHQKSHRCSLCNTEFATKKQVLWHKKNERGCKRRNVQIPKDCPTCGRHFTVMCDYFRHVEERCRKRPALTGVGQFSCSECGLVLHLERLLKAHRAFKHPSSVETP